MDLRDFKNPSERRSFIEKNLKIKLNTLGKALVDEVKDILCENLIGETTLPLGVAGPVKISNLNPPTGRQISNYYIPLATTEGALVASVNRGCKAITLSGGAQVNVHRVGATRGPVFYTGSLTRSEQFCQWLKKNEVQLAKVAQKTSKHLKLGKLDSRTLSNYVFIRFYFNTQDAMGMNMVTIATNAINQFIENETGIKCLSLAGNYDIDKKAAWLNFINNRGFKAWAEVVVSKRIIKKILKTNAKDIFEVWLGKCMLGSIMSGSLGFNAHFANVVTAFFAATGQDLAHVVEGSLGITTAKVLENGDLYMSVYLPAVMIGIIGGGTKLRTKQEALSIIGVKTSEELTEVLAGAVLAGEISLLASLAEGSLARTHERLGR